MNSLAPICLFTYNRLTETKQTVHALQNNFLAKESVLIIFSDGPKNSEALLKVEELRGYLKTITGFKFIRIYESKDNQGLAKSIINGVNMVIEKYGKVIVLEDDLISTPNFLNFMNQALEFYNSSRSIQSINGYSLKIESKEDVYFQMRTFPWGWATWKDRWSEDLFDKDQILQKIQFDKSQPIKFKRKCGDDTLKMLKDSLAGKNNSWYIRWVFNHFINNKYSVYPKYSKIENIGFSDNASHCKGINTYICELDTNFKEHFVFNQFQKPNNNINKQFLKFFKKGYKLLFRMKLLRTVSGRNRLFKELIGRINYR